MKNGINDRVHVPTAMAPPATKNEFSYEPDSWKIKPEREKHKIFKQLSRKRFRVFADRAESDTENLSLPTSTPSRGPTN